MCVSLNFVDFVINAYVICSHWIYISHLQPLEKKNLILTFQNQYIGPILITQLCIYVYYIFKNMYKHVILL